MRPIKLKILRSANAIIASLLALLGFVSSCDPMVEYGTPSAKFIVSGSVESAETSLPVENIRVIMQGDTSFTDAQGNYTVIDHGGFPAEQSFAIQFQDIDDALNGKFQDLDSIVEFKNPEFTGGDGNWYSGETSQEFNISLNPEE